MTNKSTTQNTKIIRIQLNPTMANDLDALAESMQISTHDVVKSVLEQWLKSNQTL